MGLNSSLNMAISGLRSTQVGLNIISQNVANADSPGYVRRTVSTVETQGGYTTSTNVQRLLDKIVQHQLWQESAGAAYTSTRADAMSKLDELYGAPGSSTALDSVYNAFTSSLQALKDDPSSYTNRSAVLDRAGELANRLNGLSNGVQDLRRQAESGIATGVQQVNDLLDSLTSVNAKIVGSPNDSSSASLRDQRDRIVAELSQYMDIRTSEDARGSLAIITTSGTQIFDGRPAVTFSFDQHESIGPESQWSSDPTKRGVGTITMRSASGGGVIDAIASKVFKSGEIAANIELRDKTLVQAQAQLDEIAAQMSSALSDREVAGTPVTAGAATGFDVDLTGLQSGNTVTLDYKIQPSGETRRFTFVRAETAASLPLPASASGDANNTVVGIDFSGDVAAQIQAAVGPGFTVANTGTGVSIVDDGAGNTRDVLGLTARPTATGLNGTTELPFFVDGGRNNAAYTGSYEGGSQAAGFAARIKVNPGLIADRAKLVQIDPTTPQGDGTRPSLLLDRLTQSQRSFTRATGIDGSTASSTGTISNFVQRVVASTGQAVEAAQRLDEGQQVALASVQSRFQETSQVNVDQEMSMLIELQSAYAANARIISTVKEMMDLLMRV
jgi:flagellar hook-associated protein 1 FlgK